MNCNQTNCNQTNCNQTNCNQKDNNMYGGYSKKDRKKYLLQDKCIIIDRFTKCDKDYSLVELKEFYNRVLKTSEKKSSFKKQDYFKRVNEYHSTYSSIPHQGLCKLQAFIRMKLIHNKIKLRGLSVFNRHICNNDEDFYTYESKHDIEDIYYFSYKDSHNNYWCFDVRSFKKLIDMNYGNPYTTEMIPISVKDKVVSLINYLKKNKVSSIIDTTIVADRNVLVKQKFVDIFSQIEYSGYSCDISWVLSLSTLKLKRLYKELEDIWNYRANLQQTVKCNIAPPLGRLFVMPVHDYFQCNDKTELLEILGCELEKILLARTPGDMNLGFMYFIMGLCFVSRECLQIHPWVLYAF